MTTQITVRLPDEQVSYIDQLVQNGDATSRAAAISRALKREQRRRQAEQDVLKMIAAGPDPELDTPEMDQWRLDNASQAWKDLDDTDWSGLA